MRIARGKRRAALGCGPKVISSLFFHSGLARQWRAKPEWKKREVGLGGFLPRAAASRLRLAPAFALMLRRGKSARQAAALPWATFALPLRGALTAKNECTQPGAAASVSLNLGGFCR